MKELFTLMILLILLALRLQAVYRWINKAKAKGNRSLKSVKFPGRDLNLTQRQLKELLSLMKKPASELGYFTISLFLI